MFPYWQDPLLHFIIIFRIVLMKYSKFQNIEMKQLENSFPGGKIQFIAQLWAEIWPFEKIWENILSNLFGCDTLWTIAKIKFYMEVSNEKNV